MQQTDARPPAASDAERITQALSQSAELRRQGAHREAIAVLDALLADLPRAGQLWHVRSLSFGALGDYAEAIRCCEEILSRQPANSVGLKLRIDFAARLGSPEDLARYVEDACHRAPDNLSFHLRRVALLRETDRAEEALEALAPLREAHPSDAGVLIELATILRALGRHAESLDACDAIPAPEAGEVRVVTMRMDALIRLQRVQEALEVVDRALVEHPGSPTLGLRRGQVLRDLGRHDDSIVCLAELDHRVPNNPHIMHTLAWSYRVAGDHAASLATFDRILAMDPVRRSALLARIEVMQLAGDQDGIAEMVLRAASRLAEAAGDEAGLQATVICKGLPHLPDDMARTILRENAGSLGATASTLSPDALWTTYRRADMLGLGADYAGFATALLACEELRFHTARMILRAILSVGLPNWQRIGEILLSRTVPADQGLFRAELAAMSGMPRGALAGRERNSPHFRAEHTLQIADLLRQTGRIRLAARYMGHAWRRFSNNSAVLKDYVSCLAGTGQATRARTVLEEQEALLATRHSIWREVVAQGWAEIDQQPRAMALMAAGPGPSGWRDWHVAHAIASADRKDWPALAQDFGAGNHLAPTMRGALLAESLRHADAELPAHELSVTAIARIRRWLEERPDARPAAPADAPAIPRHILQYWSQGTPPPQAQEAVAGWQRAEGFTHRLFDRTEAQRFLSRELGRDWIRAFNRAGSPTEECDFFRLCYLGLRGGIYADCDDWLIGDPELLIDPAGGLTVYREPTGGLGNNILIAPPRHPAILWAAISARNALREGHGDNVWNKTGPGLLTRAVAWRIETCAADGTDPGLRILPRWQLGHAVQYHSPLSYKSGAGYWNRRNAAGSMPHLSRAAGPDRERGLRTA